ncbi:hypothetical protein H0H93_011421 [Arthromyces matolae]|nr:hypothetical protein H0H93_011421 [Arthromyces matolae]
MSDLPPSSVLEHIVDVHCHPTDAPGISSESISQLPITICAMSSMETDQHLVRNLALANPDKLSSMLNYPGHHPWFTHRISIFPPSSKEDHYRALFLNSSSASEDHITAFLQLLPSLPDPIVLADVLLELRRNLEAFPVAMLGEVGLDRSFRVPYDYHAEQRRLTPFVVPFDHQLTILEAQINLAVELGRNISLHSVKSQLATLTLLDRMKAKHGDRWLSINLDFHSCGVSPETWQGIEAGLKATCFLFMSSLESDLEEAQKRLLVVFHSYQ